MINTITILDSKVHYYTENNLTYWQLTDILKLLREDGNGHTSFARGVVKEFPEEFIKYEKINYVSKRGVYKLIKHFKSNTADKLYTQITQVADAALDAGFMNSNNFLSVAPKSEYISYHQSLGSAVSSRKIAECFGKLHKNVIQDFENAIQELKVRELDFQPSYVSKSEQSFQKVNNNYSYSYETYVNSQGKEQKEIFVSEGLFNYVVLGYSGKAAKQWKLFFIDEFLRLRLESQKLSAAPNLIEAVKKATSKLYVLADLNVPNLYKIGITERPIEQRLSELNATVSSSVVCLWESLPCVNARQLETALHNFFKDKQVKSEVNAALTEWFKLDEFDLRELQGILKMNFRYPELEIVLIK
jgi:Rha family phage regulatory protein